MPVLKAAPKLTLAQAAEECQTEVSALLAASTTAKLYTEECLHLKKLAKRLVPLLEDLLDNKPEPEAEQEGVKALKARAWTPTPCHPLAAGFLNSYKGVGMGILYLCTP